MVGVIAVVLVLLLLLLVVRRWWYGAGAGAGAGAGVCCLLSPLSLSSSLGILLDGRGGVCCFRSWLVALVHRSHSPRLVLCSAACIERPVVLVCLFCFWVVVLVVVCFCLSFLVA